MDAPMVGPNKILTVSYGTFSCTLEGFEDPFSTMKAIAEYFRDLAADDRYFGAEPPQPDAAMLHRIAEREVQRRVEAQIGQDRVILRATESGPQMAQTAAPMAAPVATGAPTVTAAMAPGLSESVAAKLQRLRDAARGVPTVPAVAPAVAYASPPAPAPQVIDAVVMQPAPPVHAEALSAAGEPAVVAAEDAPAVNTADEAAVEPVAPPSGADSAEAEAAPMPADVHTEEPVAEEPAAVADTGAAEETALVPDADLPVPEEPAEAAALEVEAAEAGTEARIGADAAAFEPEAEVSAEPAGPDAAPELPEAPQHEVAAEPAALSQHDAEEPFAETPADVQTDLAAVMAALSLSASEEPEAAPVSTAAAEQADPDKADTLALIAALATSETAGDVAEAAGDAADLADMEPDQPEQAADADMLAEAEAPVEEPGADEPGAEEPDSEAVVAPVEAVELMADVVPEPAEIAAEALAVEDAEKAPSPASDVFDEANWAEPEADEAPVSPEAEIAMGDETAVEPEAAAPATEADADQAAALPEADVAMGDQTAVEPQAAAPAIEAEADAAIVPPEAEIAMGDETAVEPEAAAPATEAENVVDAAEAPAVPETAEADSAEPVAADTGDEASNALEDTDAAADSAVARLMVALGAAPTQNAAKAETDVLAEAQAATEVEAGPADAAAQPVVPADDAEAALAAALSEPLTEPVEPPRARVIKIRRIERPQPTVADADAPKAPEAAPLPLQADAEPQRDPSGLAAQEPAAARQHLPEAADDGDVQRLIDEANSQLEGPENRRRLSAIAHLKAAVAATVADRRATGAAPEGNENREAAYRDDLEKVVRPRRPVATGTAVGRPVVPVARPAPLVLVSEQRIDRPTEADVNAPAATGPVMPVRPRRPASSVALSVAPDAAEDETIASPDATSEEGNFFAPSKSFAEFAEALGADDLTDLLEAALAYAALVEGRPHVSRPQMLRHVGSVRPDAEAEREDMLRSFGALVRQGRIERVKAGQFALPDTSEVLAEARRIAS